ncbi:DUF4238 domain-containing protein (plasmid) [Rahnella aceris]
MSIARHHHYLSQCYLRGFTRGNAKKSRLTVIDLKNGSIFETIPRNVGGVRDFNRVEIEGVDPNYIESSLAELEGRAATALRELESGEEFIDERRAIVLELISILSVRTPEMRNHISQPFIHMAKIMMSMSFESKEIWESQIKQSGGDSSNKNGTKIEYEQMKEIYDSGGIEISVTQEHLINTEFKMATVIYELLQNRNWALVKAKEIGDEFITSDNPVVLAWQVQMPAHISPGFGLQNTSVYFPVSKNIMLVGEYNHNLTNTIANPYLVAILNSTIINGSSSRIFASSSDFSYIGKGHIIRKGKYLTKKT